MNIKVVIFLILSLLLFVPNVGAEKSTPQSTRSKQAYQRGKACMDKVAIRGQYGQDLRYMRQAISEFTQAINLDPNYSKAYYSRGEVYKLLGNINDKRPYHEAMADFSKVIELNPSNSSAYFERAQIFIFLQDPDKAEEDLNKAEELNYNLHEIKPLREMVTHLRKIKKQ